MKILVCSPCYKSGKLCEAVDMIPAMTLPVSKKKFPEQGLCSEHLTNMLENFDYVQKPVAQKKDKRKLLKGELWDLVMKVSKKYHLPIATIHTHFKTDNKSVVKAKNLKQIHAAKIAWLKKILSGEYKIVVK